jgi:hypothetical protein
VADHDRFEADHKTHLPVVRTYFLDRHVLPYFGGRKVGSIDYATVELWLADRRNAGLSPKTVRECLSVLSLVLSSLSSRRP